MTKHPKRKMKPPVRAIVNWAARHDWVLQGEKDGSGHWVLKHARDGVVRLPDTPSDPRGLDNAKAEIRRKSGLPSESGPAARYRHESLGRERFDMDAAIGEARLRRAWEEAERLKRARIQVQLNEARRALESVNLRREPQVARELAARIVDLERQLNSP